MISCGNSAFTTSGVEKKAASRNEKAPQQCGAFSYNWNPKTKKRRTAATHSYSG
jgi:hypothetical protein